MAFAAKCVIKEKRVAIAAYHAMMYVIKHPAAHVMQAKKKILKKELISIILILTIVPQNIFANELSFRFCPPPESIEKNLKKIESHLIDGFWRDKATGEVWKIDWASNGIIIDKKGKIQSIDCPSDKKECNTPLQFQGAFAGYHDISNPKKILIVCDYGYSEKYLHANGVTITSHSFSVLPPEKGKWKQEVDYDDIGCDGNQFDVSFNKNNITRKIGNIYDCPFIIKTSD